MKTRLAFALAAILIILGAPATLAAAKDAAPPSLQIHYVDDTAGATGQVGFDYAGPSKDLDKMVVKVDGETVKAGKATPLDTSGIDQNVLFVVDVSSSMGTPKELAANRDALRKMITGLPENTGVAVVSYGSKPDTLTTTDASTLEATDSIKDLGTNQGDGSVLWDSMHKGISELDTTTDAQTSVVLITDGQDTGSSVAADRIRNGLVQVGAPLYVVSLGQQGLDGSGLSEIVQSTGGQSVVVGSKADMAKGMSSMQDVLDNRYVVKVPFGKGTGQRDLEMQVGSSTAKVSFSSGAITAGATALTPVTVSKPWGPSFLQSDLAKYLALLGIALAIGLAVYGIAHLVTKDQTALSTVLRPYSDGTGPQEDSVDDGALAQTAILQRAVQMTEDFAERQGFLANVEGKLERADLPLRAAEAIFFWVAATVVIGLGSLALFGIVVGAILTIVVGIFPAAALSFMANRRRKSFDSQLPDMLGLLSGSLRAGYSLMQGMEAVAQEVTEPMGKELRRVCTEARLGRDLEEALEGVAERMSSRDFEWAVMAIRIQREVGGNLAELLLTVAETMTHRERLRREVAALTAEGKISAIVLGILPPGLGAFMFISNPEYMHGLISTTLGHILLGVATVAMIIGFVWMKKIIEIEI